jgi:hypothetical protein
MNHETAQFLLSQIDQGKEMQKMEKDQVTVDKQEMKQEV